MTHILIMTDVALAILALVIVMRQRIKGDRRTWQLFWLGFLLGLTWEVGFFLTGPLFSSAPSYQMTVRFPGHPALQPLVHSLWDGTLFLAGVWTVRLFCKAPTFRQFRFVELFVLILWGNVQELSVETLACATGLWTFLPRFYNPGLFAFGHGTITLLPQVIWTVSPAIYYFLVLRMNRRWTQQVDDQFA